MERFKKKYRIPSARLQSWDYGRKALYFITICTAHRENFFGDIINGQMHLSSLGLKATEEWLCTPEIRPDMNLLMDEFVVMPNHFHAIINIGDNIYNNEESTFPGMENIESKVSTCEKFGIQFKNLSSIVRGFKSSVTMYARINKIDFNWQTRFHDHIIRDIEEFRRIKDYIMNNPQNWKSDRFNTNMTP